MSDGKPLVIVTRPRDLSGDLCGLLRAAGAEPVAFPVIEIRPLPPTTVPPHADFVVFVSRNAVRNGVTHLKHLLGVTRVAAVGSGTAAALAAAGVTETLTPPAGAAAGGAGLLQNIALERAAIDGRQVLIVRGEGGNEDLAEGLRARGAVVSCVAVYRRTRPDAEPAALSRLRDGRRDPVFVLTSSEGVRNLFEIAAPMLADWLRERRFVAISPRVAEALRVHDIKTEPVLATAADDRSLCAAALHAATT